jgi:predicted enzyme related to lactoylglutathione lyase
MPPQLLVNVDVPDLAAAERFYTAAFGLQSGRRFGAQVVELLGGNAPIYLLEKPAGSRAAPASTQTRDYRRHWTPVHLDFVVEDLDAAITRAVAAGAALEDGPETHRWGRIAHFADPWGNGFCLLSFLNRGYDEIATAFA